MTKHLPNVKGGVPWLKDRLIFLTVHGSQAYGTSLPTSDLDLKGVAIPPVEYFHGCFKRFDQAEFKAPDAVVYGLQKFLNLAADCNPNIIEVLWTSEDEHLYQTPLGEMLLDNRELFLSKKAKHTFSGYAMSQLKRIRTHQHWLRNPAEEEPQRKDFGLPEVASISKNQMGALHKFVQTRMDSWDVDWAVISDPDRLPFQEAMRSTLVDMGVASTDERWWAAAHQIFGTPRRSFGEFFRSLFGKGSKLGQDTNFLDLLQREKRYQDAQRNWKQYHDWKKNRNPTRAALEAESGYDRKHAMHLVRLMRMGEEILTTGKVHVRRPDAEELLEIRNGAWTFDQLLEWAESQDAKLTELYKTSTALPHKPDHARLDALCMQLVEKGLSMGSFVETATERDWSQRGLAPR